ncbi:methyltransferase-like protein 6 [Galendromus occidentalis]|uniref:tRNA N(3)-methylcytidine methyltransferase n=1 Tax=Galendromus occidentalis TaxID=34638 RepID=A0AAJ7PAM5_9ACAR|nr:methyltransferase-like protein 6 [Galendromus occidentalis]XP_018496817.1 methyltransferase-like protein 6 [Galendromus occidentalis]
MAMEEKTPVTLGHRSRTLTAEEIEKLSDDKETVSDFKQRKLEEEAKKHWDKFYMRNETRFFKDRHWTTREFEELLGQDFELPSKATGDQPTLLEVGCGVGNMIVPLIEEGSAFRFLACDFSPRAVALLKENPMFSKGSHRAFVCDMTTSQLLEEVPRESVDIVTMIFMLSAISPEKMPTVINNVFSVLRPGGMVLFRDYGLYDQAQLRFKRGHKLRENFYARQDGTRAFYFSEEVVKSLFESAGFQTKENSYVTRSTINRKEGIDVPRIFVQSKFVKPQARYLMQFADGV